MNKEQEKEFKYSIKIGLNKKEMMKYNQNLTRLKIGELQKLSQKTARQAIDLSAAEEKMETISKILAQIVRCRLASKMKIL